VVGATTEKLEDEVIVLHKNDQPEAIVYSVPYLRNKDIRIVEPGETKHILKNQFYNYYIALVCHFELYKQCVMSLIEYVKNTI
jgi:hypothetical protein